MYNSQDIFCHALVAFKGSSSCRVPSASRLSWAAILQDSKGEGMAGGTNHSSLAAREEVKESLGKKKKGQKQQTLLFTTTQRRY